MTTTTKTRPDHCGAWTTTYDGREKMNAAAQAALTDAAAAEVDGYPTNETAEEWLAAMHYRVCACGGGLAEFDARPSISDGIKMAQKTLIAAAHMALSMSIATPFSRYMPLNSVGHRHYHELLALAYDSPNSDKPDWAVQTDNQKAWRASVEKAVETVRSQWSNSDWVWHAKIVVAFAIGRLPN